MVVLHSVSRAGITLVLWAGITFLRSSILFIQNKFIFFKICIRLKADVKLEDKYSDSENVVFGYENYSKEMMLEC